MARHASGKNNYSVAGWLIALIIALVVVIIAGVWWFFFRSDTPSPSASELAAQECVAGDLEVAIASDEVAAVHAQDLIDEWAQTQPVVRDYCIQPVYTTEVASAAAFVGATLSDVQDASRTTTSSEPVTVGVLPVGVAGDTSANPALDTVAFPVAEEPELSVVVAEAISSDHEAVVAALARDAEQTSESVQDAQQWASFADTEDVTHLADLQLFAAALNPNDEVSEEGSRAGAQFLDFAQQPAEGTAVSEEILAEVTEYEETPDPTAATAADQAPDDGEVEPAHTLFVLDTSEQMAPLLPVLADAVEASATELTDQGQQVALWNYSSPLNPGVTQGWRRNLTFGVSAADIGNSIRLFGSGGVPQTRSATVAATSAVAGREEPTRVLLVTSGTEQDLSDEAFAQNLQIPENVELSVVHIGAAPLDAALAEVAASVEVIESPDGQELADALRTAAGV